MNNVAEAIKRNHKIGLGKSKANIGELGIKYEESTDNVISETSRRCSFLVHQIVPTTIISGQMKQFSLNSFDFLCRGVHAGGLSNEDHNIARVNKESSRAVSRDRRSGEGRGREGKIYLPTQASYNTNL